MARRRLRLLILALMIASVADAQTKEANESPATQARPLKVLFIGNSYTYVNDLPEMLKSLASSCGEANLEVAKVALPGATLEALWEEGQARKALQQHRWDFVVLQEQSVLPTVEPERMYRYGRLFDSEIKKSGAKTVLFVTWARAGNSKMQEALDASYLHLGKDLRALVAPVGPAWEIALKANPGLPLHQSDGSHPSLTGTYLGALVFYSVLYGKPPECSAALVNGLSEKDAALVRQAAREATQAVKCCTSE